MDTVEKTDVHDLIELTAKQYLAEEILGWRLGWVSPDSYSWNGRPFFEGWDEELNDDEIKDNWTAGYYEPFDPSDYGRQSENINSTTVRAPKSKFRGFEKLYKFEPWNELSEAFTVLEEYCGQKFTLGGATPAGEIGQYQCEIWGKTAYTASTKARAIIGAIFKAEGQHALLAVLEE